MQNWIYYSSLLSHIHTRLVSESEKHLLRSKGKIGCCYKAKDDSYQEFKSWSYLSDYLPESKCKDSEEREDDLWGMGDEDGI